MNSKVSIPENISNKTVMLRVEHFAIFENLAFEITSIILGILMKHIEIKNSLDSKL